MAVVGGSSVHFSSRWCLCARKSPYELHSVSQQFPQRCLWNDSNVRLIEDNPLSSFQRRLPSASSFNTSLLRAISGVMSLALCSQIVPQASQHFWSSELFVEEGCRKPLVGVWPRACTLPQNCIHQPRAKKVEFRSYQRSFVCCLSVLSWKTMFSRKICSCFKLSN